MKLLKSTTVWVTVAALGLGGCVTNAQGERQLSKTATYGTLAAVTCGIVGAITHDKKGARNSALACGAIGAGVGAYMDVQEAQLRQQLANTGVELQRDGNQIKLTMPENVTFATNSSVLSVQAQNSLNIAAQTLAKYNETTLKIVGHTDSTGSDATNDPLSQDRAAAVRNYLNAQGVASNRMTIDGRGSRQPIASNATSEGRAQNRRVEILINPIVTN